MYLSSIVIFDDTTFNRTFKQCVVFILYVVGTPSYLTLLTGWKSTQIMGESPLSPYLTVNPRTSGTTSTMLPLWLLIMVSSVCAYVCVCARAHAWVATQF